MKNNCPTIDDPKMRIVGNKTIVINRRIGSKKPDQISEETKEFLKFRAEMDTGKQSGVRASLGEKNLDEVTENEQDSNRLLSKIYRTERLDTNGYSLIYRVNSTVLFLHWQTKTSNVQLYSLKIS